MANDTFNPELAKAALVDLIETIEATGGVVMLPNGQCAPIADEDWIDLGEAYMRACEAIGKEPKVQPRDGD